MALPLPDPVVGGRAARRLEALRDEERVPELERRLESIQRNFDKLAEQYPAGVGPQYQSQVPQCRVSRSVAFTHNSNGAYLAVPFDTEAYDLGAPSEHHSTSVNTTRLTAVIPGLYGVGGTVQWATNATGHRRLTITANGVSFVDEVFSHDPQATVPATQSLHSEYRLTAGQYFELRALQNSGGNLNIDGAHFWFSWKSP